jgi:hypothetical protein
LCAALCLPACIMLPCACTIHDSSSGLSPFGRNSLPDDICSCT